MKNYREIYCTACEKLGETYNTPAYTAARADYLKLVEELAAADIRIFEDDRSSIAELYINSNLDSATWAEILAEMAEEIAVLRRVNYPLVDRWEQEYRQYRDWVAASATC